VSTAGILVHGHMIPGLTILHVRTDFQYLTAKFVSHNHVLGRGMARRYFQDMEVRPAHPHTFDHDQYVVGIPDCRHRSFF